MDTDWCLTCDCHFGTGPYCSADCQTSAGPSTSTLAPWTDSHSDDDEYSDDDDIIYHHVDDVPVHPQWTGNDSAGILAWAAAVNCSPPSGTSTPIYPSSFSSKTPSPAHSTSRLPKLMRPNQRPAPPALCLTKPHPPTVKPSRPILTPHQRIVGFSPCQSLDAGSMGKTSLLSGATESSLATPASSMAVPVSSKGKPTIMGAIRSWVAPTPPLTASPSSSPRIKVRPKQNEAHQFTIVAHARHSKALNIGFSASSSLDDSSPVWQLSSTIVVAPPREKIPSAARADYRPRGRKVSRA